MTISESLKALWKGGKKKKSILGEKQWFCGVSTQYSDTGFMIVLPACQFDAPQWSNKQSAQKGGKPLKQNKEENRALKY